jgi:HEAT repeat protein
MKLHPLSRAALAAAFIAALAAPLAAQQAAAVVVPSALSQQLVKVFPEIASGYIDFNGNGKLDQTSDLSELIPESRVKDGQLQAQEILDFIVGNWRFIPLDKLKSVRDAVKSGSGALSELIAIDFSSSLDDAISQREAMGDMLYLTPAAYKEAMGRIGGIITAMATAYKKEGQKNEADFVSNRDALFGLIEKGYPLPVDIPQEEKSILSTAMISTMLKEKSANPSRARSAIRTLGQLKSVEAASYLLSLADGPDFQTDAIKALGDIGYKPALPVLAKQLRTSKDLDVRKASLQALGAIGGSDGLDAMLDLLKPANRAGLPKDLLEADAAALAGLTQKGNTDARIQAALKDLSSDADAAVRKSATAGLGAVVSASSSDALLAILGNDKDPKVRAEAVSALNRQKGDGIVAAFMKTLKEKDLDPTLETAILGALGDNAQGSQAIPLIVDDLGDKDAGVRAAASAALRKLYPANQAVVTSSITRSLLASQDPSFLATGAALLADLADPSTLTALLTLLQSPDSEVKRNVTWALYKIRSSTNPRVMDELQKLITNENETLEVRANAVRAVGAIGYDSPQLNLWQTLVTTAQMRGDKYAMLRYFSVGSLGKLGSGRPQVVGALSRIALRESDLDLRKEAVAALKDIAMQDKVAEEALASTFAQADDPELKVLVIEALADMGSNKPSGLAGDFLSAGATAGGSAASVAYAPTTAQKRRVISALAQSPDEASANAVLDASRDKQISDFAEAILEGYPSSVMQSLVARRLRTETDKEVLSVLASLDTRFSE